MQQKRLVIALLISTAILFGWNYLFPLKAPQQAKPGSSSSTAQSNKSAQPEPVQAAPPQQASSNSLEAIPQRIVTIKTPLYEAKIDSHGAVVVSWILKKNAENGRALYSAGGDQKNPIPLEILSEEGLRHQP